MLFVHFSHSGGRPVGDGTIIVLESNDSTSDSDAIQSGKVGWVVVNTAIHHHDHYHIVTM